MEFPVVEIPKRLNEIPVVDSENTLTNFTTLQQQLINNNKSESIICLEKTTTHHSFYDVEKLAGDNIVNNSSMSTTAASGDRVSSRLLGMGNPAIIGIIKLKLKLFLCKTKTLINSKLGFCDYYTVNGIAQVDITSRL